MGTFLIYQDNYYSRNDKNVDNDIIYGSKLPIPIAHYNVEFFDADAPIPSRDKTKSNSFINKAGSKLDIQLKNTDSGTIDAGGGSVYMLVRGLGFNGMLKDINTSDDPPMFTATFSSLTTPPPDNNAAGGDILFNKLVGNGNTTRIFFYPNLDELNTAVSTLQQLTLQQSGIYVGRLINKMKSFGVLNTPGGLCECPSKSVTTGDFSTEVSTVSFTTAFFIMCTVVMMIGIIAVSIAKMNAK